MPAPPDPPPNPLLAAAVDPKGDASAIRRAHLVKLRDGRRDIRDLRRKQSAREAVAGLSLDGSEIFGFTKGQFSLIDLLEAVLEHTGPAALHVSTWTAANTDVTKALELIDAGRITRARSLVDIAFVRRCPQLAARIRSAFGPDCIRVTANHAKFAILENGQWRAVVRTSMNLNHNPRLEDFTVAHDPELAAFILEALNDIWTTQRRSLADATYRDVGAWFAKHG
jgi:hypothetical protein